MKTGTRPNQQVILLSFMIALCMLNKATGFQNGNFEFIDESCTVDSEIYKHFVGVNLSSPSDTTQTNSPQQDSRSQIKLPSNIPSCFSCMANSLFMFDIFNVKCQVIQRVITTL